MFVLYVSSIVRAVLSYISPVTFTSSYTGGEPSPHDTQGGGGITPRYTVLGHVATSPVFDDYHCYQHVLTIAPIVVAGRVDNCSDKTEAGKELA